MRVRIVLGIALTLVGVAVAVTLSQAKPRLAGTSFVAQGTFVVLPPHATACQRNVWLADDAAAAQLLVGTYGQPLPALALTFTGPDGTVLAHGARAAGGADGPVTVRFTGGAVDGNRVATACVRNGGAHRIALGGAVANPDAAARVAGRPVGGVVGFRYFRAGRESWWSLAPTLAQRFGLGKARVLGTWTLPLLALMLAGLWVVVVRLLLREAE